MTKEQRNRLTALVALWVSGPGSVFFAVWQWFTA